MQNRRFNRASSSMRVGLTSLLARRVASWARTRLHLGEGSRVVRCDAKRIASRSRMRMLAREQNRQQQLIESGIEAPHSHRVWSWHELRWLSGDLSLEAIGIGCRRGLDVTIVMGQRSVNPSKDCLLGWLITRLEQRSYKPLGMRGGRRVGSALNNTMGDRVAIRLGT